MSGAAARSDRRVSNGIGMPWVLFFIFLVLKLTHTVDWSWWWVTAPLWITYSIGVAIILIALVVVGVKSDDRRGKLGRF